MKQNYHIEDYRFTTCCVYYQGEFVSTFQLVKHLNHWWPSIRWNELAKVGYYNELKAYLEYKLNVIRNEENKKAKA